MKLQFNPLTGQFELAENRASQIHIQDEKDYFVSKNVEGALQEIAEGRFNSLHIGFYDLRYLRDAPSDGTTYGRKNNAWEAVVGGGGTWGSITGTLSDQTDINTALNAKVSDTGDTMTGNLVVSGAGLYVDAPMYYLDGAKTIHRPETNSIALGASTLEHATPGANNIAIGYLAAQNNTGSYNLFIGYQSGKGNTGNYCTGFGAQTLRVNTGADNSAFGYEAGYNNTSGLYNVYFAYGAGYSNKTGNYNAYIGVQAGFSAVNASNNIFVGTFAGYNITGSDNVGIGYYAIGNGSAAIGSNVAIGSVAGYNTTGSRNIFIGYYAGSNDTGSDHLYIANSNTPHPLIYGNMAIGTTHVQINGRTTTNNAPLEVLKLQNLVSTASTGGANGFGVAQGLYAETATDGTYQQQAQIATSWIDATNATRKAKLSLSAYDTAARLGIEIEASGSAVKLGFFGATPIVKPSAYTPTNVTTDRSYDANATTTDELADVLGTLIADLQSLGLIS